MPNIPSVSPLFNTHTENQTLTHIWLPPSESQTKWREVSIYREFASVAQIGGKTNGVESGRFLSILVKSLPIVSPSISGWETENKKNKKS